MARKFLYVIASIIVLFILAAFAYRIWGQRLISAALVPTVDFAEQRPFSAEDYARPDMWYARPDITKDNPAIWTPAGYKDRMLSKKAVTNTAGNQSASTARAATFFIHPTSYINRSAWNDPLDDADAIKLARQYVRVQASVFSGIGSVWAPKYRQATFGSFLTDKPEAQRALDAAYKDVSLAFSVFLARNAEQPIVLGAHSQGTVHLMRLLRERISGTPIASRIAAVYAVGWPISVTTDVPALGIPLCQKTNDTGCILGWQSFAEPADPSSITAIYEAGIGFTGKPRKGSRMLCTNPISGTLNGSANAQANLGTLQPEVDAGEARLVSSAVSARCDAQGFLLIGPPPDLGPFVLPGNNYHVYDYSLFWANIRRDVTRRVEQFPNR